MCSDFVVDVRLGRMSFNTLEERSKLYLLQLTIVGMSIHVYMYVRTQPGINLIQLWCWTFIRIPLHCNNLARTQLYDCIAWKNTHWDITLRKWKECGLPALIINIAFLLHSCRSPLLNSCGCVLSWCLFPEEGCFVCYQVMYCVCKIWFGKLEIMRT